MAQRPDASKQSRWLDLVQRWLRSHSTVREFCELHQLSEASFYSWRRVLRQRGLLDEPAAPPPSAPPVFVKLDTAPPADDGRRGDGRRGDGRCGDAVEVVLASGCACAPASTLTRSASSSACWRTRHAEPVPAGPRLRLHPAH